MSALDPRKELARLVRDTRRQVANKKTGTLRTRRAALSPLAKKTPPPPAPVAARGISPLLSPVSPPPLSVSLDTTGKLSKADQLIKLREDIGDCRRCPLGASRIQLAFGVGNPDARVMFIGEGPGYAEDRQGEPFVGPAGKLLDKILTATDLSRQPMAPAWKWIYIANMVKCHPMIDPSDNTKRGNDRPPTPEEMAVCSPFLMAQIRIIRPLFIVALGATAGKALLRTEEGISKFRGRWVDFSPTGDDALRIRLMPTYHPAALLRNPNLKKDVWEDMKNLKAELEKAVS